MSKTGQLYIAATEGTAFTLYAMCKKLGIPLTKEQEKFQAYLEGRYPAIVEKMLDGKQDKNTNVLY